MFDLERCRLALLCLWVGSIITAPWSIGQEVSLETLQSAAAAYNSGRYDESERLFRACLEAVDRGAAPEDYLPDSLRVLSLIYRKQGRFEDAVAVGRRFHEYKRRWSKIDGNALRLSALELAGDEFAAGNPAEADALLNEALAPVVKEQKIDPMVQLRVELLRAQVGRESLPHDQAERRWRDAIETVQRLLKYVSRGAVERSQIPYLYFQWANCHAALGEADEAQAVLQQLLDYQARNKNYEDYRNTLIEMARHHSTLGQYSESKEKLVQAESIQRKYFARDQLGLAELLDQLGATCWSAQDPATADDYWSGAAAIYQKQVDLRGGSAGDDFFVSIFLGRLLRIQQQLRDFPSAIGTAEQLLAFLSRKLGASHPSTYQAKSDLGALYGQVGYFDRAEPLLREVVRYWRDRDPPRPLKLADALNNLAVVERATGSLDKAEELFEEVVSIRQRILTSDSPELAGVYNNLASTLVAKGRYAQAIALYRNTIDICTTRGRSLDGLRSTTLLNLAIAYRSQGQFDRAAEFCQQSLDLIEGAVGPEAFVLVGHLNALAALFLEEKRFTAAEPPARRALAICQAHDRSRSLEAATTLHSLAIVAQESRRFAEAIANWEEALAIQTEHGQDFLAARSRNRLGYLSYGLGRTADAERYFRAVLEFFDRTQARPQDHYSALCNLAMVLDRGGNRAQAIDLLRQAVGLTETPRIGVAGDEEQRAEFFAQFADAFDLLVQWNLEEGNIAEAFTITERGRSRTFLDQLERAGVDLREVVRRNPGGARLLEEETRLTRELNALRTQARVLVQSSAAPAEVQQLTARFVETRRQYAEKWREIRSAFYLHSLGGQVAAADSQAREEPTLAAVQKELLAPKTLMLFYVLGSKKSYLLLIGPWGFDVQSFPLEITKESAHAIVQLGLDPAGLVATQRGLIGTVETEIGEKLDEPDSAAAGIVGPLTRESVHQIVARYLFQLRNPRFGAQRGLVGTVQTEVGGRLPDESTAGSKSLADILVPPTVRETIRSFGADHLIVVPDGALHQLPFEALVLEEAPSPRFLLDEMPPIDYAPSVSILAGLMRRPVPTGDRKLVSVGDPVYQPIGDAENVLVASRGFDRRAFEEFAGRLPPLPGTKIECARISRAFQGEPVDLLEGRRASESNLRSAIAGGCRFLHLAAHGLVDDRFGNLFGSIALTPALDSASARDDGFLELREIHSLPLVGCELAVLSACQTNVGPDRPMETSNSLAQAFLTAGVRRVVASHWSVADDSTAELMSVFFTKIADSLKSGQATDYAEALYQARKHVRHDPRWPAPYYWAPFVLLGPAR